MEKSLADIARENPDDYSNPDEWLETRDPELASLLAWYCEAYSKGEVPNVYAYMEYVKRNTGRNDPCWCDSGKKFKKCHGREA